MDDLTLTLRQRFEMWLQAQRPKLSQAAFARQIPISESHLSLVLDGKRPISLRKAARISDLTGIPMNAFASACVTEAYQ